MTRRPTESGHCGGRRRPPQPFVMMTTDEIMALALEMAGFAAVPEDSGVFVEGRDIRRVLQLARTLGMDLVLVHHPPGTTPDAWKVYLRQPSRRLARLHPVSRRTAGPRTRGDDLQRRD